MIRNSSKYNEENYSQFDDSLNPYTVLERRPSQEYIFEELSENDNRIDDLKSIGNPYAYHPNYTTPSQYFSHLMNNSTNATDSMDNLLTSTDIINISDPFYYNSMNIHSVNVNAPNHITLNKYVLSSESVEDISRLNVQFPYKDAPIVFPTLISRSTETLNKKMMTSGSIYELEKIDSDFEEKYNSETLETNLLKIRDFSAQSLADLRDLQNLSQYSNFNDWTTSKDNETSVEIVQK